MESHGLPFVSSAATLSSKWFTCCQNGSVRQVQEVHEEVQGRILNARHYMVRSRASSGAQRPSGQPARTIVLYFPLFRPACPAERKDWRRGGRAERTPRGGQIPGRCGRPAGDPGQCTEETRADAAFSCTPATSGVPGPRTAAHHPTRFPPAQRGCTALLRAASESRDDVVRFLLRRRVAKDVVDEVRPSPTSPSTAHLTASYAEWNEHGPLLRRGGEH